MRTFLALLICIFIGFSVPAKERQPQRVYVVFATVDGIKTVTAVIGSEESLRKYKQSLKEDSASDGNNEWLAQEAATFEALQYEVEP